MSVEGWLAVRQAVLADPGLQAQLWPLDESAFRRRLVELGSPPGDWPWDPGQAEVGPGAPLLAQAPQGPGWTLAYLDSRHWPPRAHWLQTGGEAPTAPFHAEDAYAWSRRPLNRFLDVRTPVAALPDGDDGPDPAGIVFHMSRCGSTLTARMLGSLPDVLSLSEPRAIADVLRYNRFDRMAGGAERARRLRAVTTVLAGGAARYVIKADALAIFDLATFREAFPHTPWIFLHRDPLEVLLSQQRDRAPEMSQGLKDLGPQGAGLSEDEFCARALGQICTAAADALAADGSGQAIAYEDLPQAVADRIAPRFGLTPDRAAMAAVANLNARRGQEAFVDDRTARRAAASDELKALAARWVEPAASRLRSA